MGNVRHVAVILSAVVFFVVGALWYTVLAGPWLTAIGKTMEQMTREGGGSPAPYAIGFLAILLMCYTLAALINRLAIRSAGAGVVLGVMLGIGLIGGMLALNYGFELRSPTLWLINALYATVGLAIAGAIIGGWQKQS
jgi:hypothetical protein